MNNDKDNNNFDEDNFQLGKPSSFKDVVMRHLGKIAELSTHEMRGGYNIIITGRAGEEREMYVQDSREQYSNAVLCFAFLLLPKFDKTMKSKYEKFQEKKETLRKEFLESSSLDEVEILGESYYEGTKDKVLLEEYKIKKIQIYYDLFAELSKQLGRLNYLEIGGGTF